MNILNIFADFETRNNETNTQGIIDIATISYELNNQIINKEFTYLKNSDHIVKQLLDFVVDLKKSTVKKFDKRNNNHILIYFHNGANYDNFFVIDWMLENGMVQRLDTNINNLNNNEFNLIASDFVKILGITLKYKDCIIHFKDSYKKLTYSIKKIGELVNRDKLIDIGEKYYGKNFYQLTEQEQKEYLNYAVEDTNIQILGMNYFKDFLNKSVENNNVDIKKIKNIDHWQNYTLSQAAKNIFETIEYNKFKHFVIEPQQHNNHHYKGGYTICNPKYLGKIVENVKSYDINSSYPAIMLQPVACEEISLNDYDFLPNKKRSRLFTVFIYQAKLKKGYVPIIRKMKTDISKLDNYIENNFTKNDNDKFFSKIKNFTFPFLFWEEEFEYVKKFYEIDYEIVKIQYFKKEILFDRYINYFKQQKENADNLKQTTTQKSELLKLEMVRNFSKLAMNCLSGKFGQKIKNENWFATNKKLELGVYNIDNKLVNIIREKESLSKNSYLYKFAYLNEDCTRYINKLLPNNFIISYITAIGRCKLFEVIEKLKDNFVYCDTDSIYCINEELPNELLDNSEFGKWKFEGSWKYFKCLKPKCYILSNVWDLKNIDWKNKELVKTTIAGFQQLLFLKDLNDLNDFKLGLESEEITVKKGKEGGKVWETRKKML